MREGDIKEGKTWDGSGIRGKSHSTSVTGDVSIVRNSRAFSPLVWFF